MSKSTATPQQRGALGGRARHASLTPEQRAAVMLPVRLAGAVTTVLKNVDSLTDDQVADLRAALSA